MSFPLSVFISIDTPLSPILMRHPTGGPRLGGLRGRLGECWEVARSQHGGTLRGGVHAGGFPFRVYQGRVLIRRATV